MIFIYTEINYSSGSRAKRTNGRDNSYPTTKSPNFDCLQLFKDQSKWRVGGSHSKLRFNYLQHMMIYMLDRPVIRQKSVFLPAMVYIFAIWTVAAGHSSLDSWTDYISFRPRTCRAGTGHKSPLFCKYSSLCVVKISMYTIEFIAPKWWKRCTEQASSTPFASPLFLLCCYCCYRCHWWLPIADNTPVCTIREYTIRRASTGSCPKSLIPIRN